MKYHVRHPNGTTVDFLRNRRQALELARKEHLQVYEVDPASGRATRIA